jgi:hypothetical protein
LAQGGGRCSRKRSLVGAGQSGGLVVAHLDRFGRSLVEAPVAIE